MKPRPLPSSTRFARSGLRPTPLVLALAAGFAMPAAAQAPADGAALRSSDELLERLPPDARRAAPTFIRAGRIEGVQGGETLLENEVELRRHDTTIRADRLRYDADRGDVKAEGQVRIQRDGNRFSGPRLEYNVDEGTGVFESPSFERPARQGVGEAQQVEFLGRDRLRADAARYSTCPRPPGGGWSPAWEITARTLTLDEGTQTGTASQGLLWFQGVPLLGTPYLSFPLGDERKTGLLPPTINLDNLSGFELTLPYYLNLAPNYDATLYPTLMTKRGLDLGGEFRYLQPRYEGRVRASWMANDRLRDRDRWSLSVKHDEQLTLGWPGLTLPSQLRVNYNRVSDHDYWRDFTTLVDSLNPRLFAQELEWRGRQGPWSLSAGAYRWQTLQDPTALITPPYNRVPSLSMARGGELGGWYGAFHAEITRFERDYFASEAADPLKVDGARTLLIGTVERRWETPGAFLHPRLRLHGTHYRFDAPIAGQRSASRVLPTASLDAGLVLERPTSFLGVPALQTLEPRAFFTWTPYRDQSGLPNYDSAALDFSLPTLFSEHSHAGHDRVSDTRALTLGVTTRWLREDDATELLRLGVAQRLRLQDQRVVLPGETPTTGRLSDLLISAQTRWHPHWSGGTTVQFNPKTDRSTRTTLNLRYQPGPLRVLNAAYRLQRGSSEQLDLSWQWPLNTPRLSDDPTQIAGRWYGVGRLNYSLSERKLVDVLAGFEYDAGCWLARVVLEQRQRGSASASQRVLFQLEFSGFSRIGSNPLKTLQENIPRYQLLREETVSPSRFQHHD